MFWCFEIYISRHSGTSYSLYLSKLVQIVELSLIRLNTGWGNFRIYT